MAGKTVIERAAARSQAKPLVAAALFTALGCVATMVLVIPSPTGGYMNLGDAVVLLGAYLLGPVWGAVAGGLGPAIADLLAGYAMYAPATLVIKALMGLTAALLYKALGRRPWAPVLCGLAAESIMVLGYWLFDAVLATAAGQSFAAGLAGTAIGIPSNLVQGIFGLAASTLLAAALGKSAYVRREFPRL